MINEKVQKEKVNGKQGAAKDDSQGKETRGLPSRENVREWGNRDLKSAIAFLVCLDQNPDIFQQAIDEIYDVSVNVPKLP